MNNITAGIFGFIFSLAILKYRKTVKEWIGNIGWAEKYLGMGGTHTVIVFLGIIGIAFSIMQMFGGLTPFLGGIFGWLVPTPS